jgi:hypothetical protein
MSAKKGETVTEMQTCATLTARNQIVDCNAVGIGRLHDVKKLVFDIFYVDLSAHNFERFSADGPEKIVDVKHG